MTTGDTTINKGGGRGRKNGEFCCGCFRFSKPNLTLVALCALAGSGEAATLDKLARRRRGQIHRGDVGGLGRGETLSAGEISFLFFLFYPNLT